MSSTERPSKQQAFSALLKEGWTSLHLDARRAGVLVPDPFRNEAHLILQYGHDLPIPIPDLEIDEDGVQATLSFSRTAHRTVVPWTAVYAVTGVDGRGVLFAEDVPSDVSVIAAPVPDTDGAADGAMGDELPVDPTPPPAVRRLQAVPAHAEPAPELLGPLVARRRKRPQLRLVK
ncbi:MAG TPA: ClpXP protease specificity-enhancing factor SspB [Polyangia bacterium]|nr:ClpXP protease specificity-enhancing factor SspB [Polyangia bacterium]